MKYLTTLSIVCALLVGPAAFAQSQDYPNRTIKILVSAPPGGGPDIAARMTDTQLVHVPYRGTAQAVNDIVAGHVDMMFLELSAAFELYKGGRAKILAVASKERVAVLPNVPTLQEIGLADFESLAWNALAAPPKTPAAIVAKLNAAINEIFRTPEIKEHFAKLNTQLIGGTPAQTTEFLKFETRRWSAVIRAANVTVN